MQSERKELDILKSLEVFGTHRSNVNYEFSTFLFSSKTEKFLSQVIIIGRSNVIWDHSNNLICLPCGPALRGVFMSDEHRGVTRKKVIPACDDYTSAAAFISFFTRSGMEVLHRRGSQQAAFEGCFFKNTHTQHQVLLYHLFKDFTASFLAVASIAFINFADAFSKSNGGVRSLSRQLPADKRETENTTKTL